MVLLAFVFEFIRDIQRPGDFQGYVNAGNAVLMGQNIYADYLNTWPPFFALFSVPLALLDQISPLLVRGMWLIGIAASWYFLLKLGAKFFLGRVISLRRSDDSHLHFTDWKILLPFLLVFRFVLDDLSNLQINSMLLLASLVVVILADRKQNIPAGVLLALIISLKVYPIFILIYFMFKRHWSIVWPAVFGLLLINGLTMLVFGTGDAVTFYADWFETRLQGPVILNHKNQSLFAWVGGLITDGDRALPNTYNILSLEVKWIKPVAFTMILLVGVIPMWQMRSSYAQTSATSGKWEIALLLASIPILSPLAWKYYFVFLWPLLLMLYNHLQGAGSRGQWLVFMGVLCLLILTTDGLIQKQASDISEALNCITIGTVTLLLLGFRIRQKLS